MKIVHAQTLLQITIPVGRFSQQAFVEALDAARGARAVLQTTFAVQISDDEQVPQQPLVAEIGQLSEDAMTDAYLAIAAKRDEILAASAQAVVPHEQVAANGNRAQRRASARKNPAKAPIAD